MSASDAILPPTALLQGLDVSWADGRTETVSLAGSPRVAVDRGSFAETSDLGLLVADILGGGPPRRDVLRATLTFAEGESHYALQRDFERDRVDLVAPDGRTRRIEGVPSRALFGLDRSAFRRTALLRGGDHAAVGGGRDALGAALRRLLGIAATPTASPSAAENKRELDEIRGKLREVESALRELGADEAQEAPVNDPPELGRLLESLEEAREIDRRLISRRLELARELSAIEDADEAPGAPSREAQRELRECLRLTEASERELNDLRRRSSSSRTGNAIGVVVLIGLLAASGLMLAGQFVLQDPNLATMGLRAAGGVLALGFAAWVGRTVTVFRLGASAKTARAKAQKLTDRSRRAIREVGGPTTVERADAETLREISERFGRRNVREELSSALAPFVDEADEVQWLRQLEMGLARDLSEIAAGAETGPALPLVRATDEVVALARNWNGALEANRQAVARQVEDRVRGELEREMLEKARRRLRQRVDELTASPTAPEASREGEAMARRLNQLVAPALAEILGDGAPSAFDEDLRPVEGFAPDAETNALTLLLVRLLVLSSAQPANRHLGTFFVDPGIALSPAREGAFLRWLAREPRLGRLVILASRAEVLSGMRRRGAGDWLALIREVRSRDAEQAAAPAAAIVTPPAVPAAAIVPSPAAPSTAPQVGAPDMEATARP